MNTEQINCSYSHRLFDIMASSKLNILIKCSNKKHCPHKNICGRSEVILLGDCEPPLTGEYRKVQCSYCKKRLLDVSSDSDGGLLIKCDYCGRVNIVNIVPK
jgi:hypothetical protein